MLDLYFSKYSFAYDKSKGLPSELMTTFSVTQSVKSDDKNQVRVVIDTSLADEDRIFVLDLQTIGYFRLNAADLEEDIAAEILKKNTVSIMFSFIRSQISLLTTQPGITPVMLQPIDVNALMDDAQE